MKNIKFIFIFLLVPLLFAAKPVKKKMPVNNSLSIDLSGRGPDGKVLTDHIQIFPNKKIEWEINSKGSPCPQSAGLFEGKITNDEFEKLLKMAQTISEENPPEKKEDAEESPFEFSTIISMRYKGKSLAFQVHKRSDSLKTFQRELAFLKMKLSPLYGVEMSASRTKDKVNVTFKHIGKEPFGLILPKAAAESFQDDMGVELEYSKSPKKILNVLSPTNKEVTVSLKSDSTQEVSFQNSNLQHHGIKRKDFPNFMEVDLCAPLAKKSK